jgi:hypothetical protein
MSGLDSGLIAVLIMIGFGVFFILVFNPFVISCILETIGGFIVCIISCIFYYIPRCCYYYVLSFCSYVFGCCFPVSEEQVSENDNYSIKISIKPSIEMPPKKEQSTSTLDTDTTVESVTVLDNV